MLNKKFFSFPGTQKSHFWFISFASVMTRIDWALTFEYVNVKELSSAKHLFKNTIGLKQNVTELRTPLSWTTSYVAWSSISTKYIEIAASDWLLKYCNKSENGQSIKTNNMLWAQEAMESFAFQDKITIKLLKL